MGPLTIAIIKNVIDQPEEKRLRENQSVLSMIKSEDMNISDEDKKYFQTLVRILSLSSKSLKLLNQALLLNEIEEDIK